MPRPGKIQCRLDDHRIVLAFTALWLCSRSQRTQAARWRSQQYATTLPVTSFTEGHVLRAFVKSMFPDEFPFRPVAGIVDEIGIFSFR